MTPIAVTIAGSDSGGGAGIQADLKTFSALGVYGASVITALTAQNTLGVQGIFPVDPDFIGQQIDSVYSDLKVSATKIGMVSQVGVIKAIVSGIHRHKIRPVVFDPVMVATSGDLLVQADAIAALTTSLLPLAQVITPICMRPPLCWAAQWPAAKARCRRRARRCCRRAHALF